jgi:hypothetical protein
MSCLGTVVRGGASLGHDLPEVCILHTNIGGVELRQPDRATRLQLRDLRRLTTTLHASYSTNTYHVEHSQKVEQSQNS